MPKSLKSLIDLFDDETILVIYDEIYDITIARDKAHRLKKVRYTKGYLVTYLSIMPSCEVVVSVIHKTEVM